MPLALSYRLLLKAAHEEKFRVLADVRDLQPQHSYIATDLLPNTKYACAMPAPRMHLCSQLPALADPVKR